MGNSETEYLLELWDKNICPFCGQDIAEGTRIGSGKRSEGGFCSMDCFARYHEAELVKRSARLIELIERHRKS